MAKQTAPLKRNLEKLFTSEPDDTRLLGSLEDLTEASAFSGLTWYWGPILYGRNREMFRLTILTRFSTWAGSKPIAWKTHAKSLESWLAKARSYKDTQVVRLLLRWKYAGKNGNIDRKLWCKSLVESYQAAPTSEARAIVLDEFSYRPVLDEATALALYATDTAARDFIIAHIPRWYFQNTKSRRMWTNLSSQALENGDDSMYFALYRATMPLDAWALDASELARRIADPVTLVAELERRHPEESDTVGGQEDVLLDLLKQRGRDLIPYVEPRLLKARSEQANNVKPFIKLAESNGWWDFWAATLQHCSSPQAFNTAFEHLLSASVKEHDRRARLQALAEASQKRASRIALDSANTLTAPAARINLLRDDVAVELYRQYPELLRDAFLPHIIQSRGNDCPKLLQAALDAKDADLVDALASHYATSAEYRHFRSPVVREENQRLKTAASLAIHYRVMRATDPEIFASRASSILKHIPAGAIQDYPHLLRTNELARLLFQRSFNRLLAIPQAAKPLVEGANEYVQMLGYRMLAADDARARTLAAEMLDLILERPLAGLKRTMRSYAFGALANAARANIEAARRVLAYARETLERHEQSHMKAELIALIGQILHAHPDLREAEEIPQIFQQKAA
ncbi:MAG: hypothetical protein P8Y36_01090 [Alphaproteobacteria bacterium]